MSTTHHNTCPLHSFIQVMDYDLIGSDDLIHQLYETLLNAAKCASE